MIKYSLVNDLINMGLKHTDTVLIHSSCKKIGYDANIILDVLMDYFRDGLLILPTHTWKNVNEDNPIYDPVNTMPCVGVLPTLFMKRKEVYRSLHPTHSVCCYGKDASCFIRNEEYNNTPCTPNGVYDRLRLRNAKVLLIGVGNERNTFIHSVEEVLNIPNRLANKPMHLYIKKDGKLIDSYMRKHYNKNQPHISLDFVKLDEALINLGGMFEAKFGNAKTYVFDTNKSFDIIRYILRKEPEIIVNGQITKDLWCDYKKK